MPILDMSNSDKKKYIYELSEKIRYNNYMYYVLDSPIIEDYEYDELLNELKAIEDEYPELALDDSPTKVIGGYPLNDFKKVSHKIQMGSLQDIFDKSELFEFDLRVKSVVDEPTYVVEPKIDGLSVSLEYKNSKFFKASTRGDGFVGEDVTLNVSAISNLPINLPLHIDYLEVRAEVFISKKNFIDICLNENAQNKPSFKNPRNAAAGSLRQKDPNITAKRKLEICAFNIQQIYNYDIISHKESLDFLSSIGFFTPPGYELFNNIDDVVLDIEKIQREKANFIFEIDGAVVKVDNLLDRIKIGGTSKFPKWAVAYKYPADKKKTTLRAIEINVGRSGVLTPTALFDPILISGSTVTRAVLHNQNIIDEKDIRIGDEILVQKAGDIIPEVVMSLSHVEGSLRYKLPDRCPVCSTEVVTDEANSFCVNPGCVATLTRNIIHFVSRDAMNIEGLGGSTIEKLVENNFIKTSADIYYLKREDLLSFYKKADKIVSNIFSSIEKSKKNELSNLIFGLGIKNIGKRASKLICKKMSNIDQISNSCESDFLNIDGFGEIMAKNIVKYFSLPQTKIIIEKFKSAGLNLKSDSYVSDVDGPLVGLKFVVTGRLEGYSREDIKFLIESNGGEVLSGVSKKINYLIAGESTGSKLNKAREIGIKILNQSDFIKLLE